MSVEHEDGYSPEENPTVEEMETNTVTPETAKEGKKLSYNELIKKLRKDEDPFSKRLLAALLLRETIPWEEFSQILKERDEKEL